MKFTGSTIIIACLALALGLFVFGKRALQKSAPAATAVITKPTGAPVSVTSQSAQAPQSPKPAAAAAPVTAPVQTTAAVQVPATVPTPAETKEIPKTEQPPTAIAVAKQTSTIPAQQVSTETEKLKTVEATPVSAELVDQLRARIDQLEKSQVASIRKEELAKKALMQRDNDITTLKTFISLRDRRIADLEAKVELLMTQVGRNQTPAPEPIVRQQAAPETPASTDSAADIDGVRRRTFTLNP